MNVLIDTSVWIEFFAGRPVANEVEWALKEGRAISTPLIASEVLSGRLSAQQRKQIIDLFDTMGTAPFDAHHWYSVGEFRAKLRTKSIQISTPDAHIAKAAIDAKSTLASLDSIFKAVAKKTELRLLM